MFDVRTTDLRRLNSITKYPSILTYHGLGDRGRLTDEVLVPFTDSEIVSVTEKIDGTNARMIFLPDGTYILGSREELLYAKGDLIGDQAQGIVEALKPIAERLPSHLSGKNIRVYYGEVYGGKVSSNSKQYTTEGLVGFRLFDIGICGDFEEKLSWTPERIASWREHGGQEWASETTIVDEAWSFGLKVTPRLVDGVLLGDSIPTSVGATYEWLKEHIHVSQARLDPAAPGRPEGVVVRSFDRTRIAKIRYEDYERTLRKK